MKTLVLFFIAVIIWCAGINGRLGSILAAVIDPASLVDGSQVPSTYDGSAGQDFNSPGSQASKNNPTPTTGAGASF